MTRSNPEAAAFRRFARPTTEFLTIVIGVLVALGLESVVSRSSEASEERAYIEQLIADLAETERQMEEADDHPANSLVAGDALILAIQRGDGLSNDSIRALLIGGLLFNNPVPIFSAADALMSRGRLHVLGPEERSAIAAWLSYGRDFELEPLYQKEGLFRETLHVLAGRVGIPEDLPAPPTEVEWIPAGQDLQHMLRDPETYAALQSLRDLSEGMGRYRARMDQVTRELRLRLEGLR